MLGNRSVVRASDNQHVTFPHAGPADVRGEIGVHPVEVPQSGEEEPVVPDDERRCPNRTVAVARIPLFHAVGDPSRASVDDYSLLHVPDGIDLGRDVRELQGDAFEETEPRVRERDAVAVDEGESLSGEGFHEVARLVLGEADFG